MSLKRSIDFQRERFDERRPVSNIVGEHSLEPFRG
jgi:hypothetical protein